MTTTSPVRLGCRASAPPTSRRSSLRKTPATTGASGLVGIAELLEGGDDRVPGRLVGVLRHRARRLPPIEVDVDVGRSTRPADFDGRSDRQRLRIGGARRRAHRAGYTVFGLLGFGDAGVDQHLSGVDGEPGRRESPWRDHQRRRLGTEQIAPNREDLVGHHVAVANEPLQLVGVDGDDSLAVPALRRASRRAAGIGRGRQETEELPRDGLRERRAQQEQIGLDAEVLDDEPQRIDGLPGAGDPLRDEGRLVDQTRPRAVRRRRRREGRRRC